jgi:TfoX/Sxy family transcriptional regulator of competence genes
MMFTWRRGVAYDEGLAQRIGEILGCIPELSEKRMFGGLCYLWNGNMAFGIVGEELMVRTGPDVYEEALQMPYAREMNFTGRAMKGMVYIATPGLEDDVELTAWLERGLNFARTLPSK